MTKKTGWFFILMMLALVAGAVIVDRLFPPSVRPPGVLAFVVDTSTSVKKSCNDLVAVMRGELGTMARGKGSHLALISLGSSASRFEPQLVYEHDVTRRSTGRQAERDDEAMLGEVLTACQQLPDADGSAIFRAARIALAYVEAKCADVETCQGRVWMATDGEENMAAGARELLAGVTPKGKGKSKAPAVTLLNNDVPQNLQIVMCGYTSTSEGGAPRTNEALLDNWRGLFTRPDGVRFEPYCTGPKGAAAAAGE